MPGVSQCGLQGAQDAPVGAERHDADVGLVAEHRRGDDLAVVGFGRLDRRDHRFAIGPRRRLAEQVDNAETVFHQHASTLPTRDPAGFVRPLTAFTAGGVRGA